MATLLFSLRNVPDEEADEIRALLAASAIDVYETASGRWGISSPAIWLRDDTQLAHARKLIDEYQTERFRRERAAYEARARIGENPSFLGELLAHPVRFAIYLLAVILILYFSVAPFFL
ncbi:MAG: DUF6164 family protein [Thiotrichales bacterium]